MTGNTRHLLTEIRCSCGQDTGRGKIKHFIACCSGTLPLIQARACRVLSITSAARNSCPCNHGSFQRLEQKRQGDGRAAWFFIVPILSLFPFLSPKTAGLSWVSPLLWFMAFYSYVIAFPNSCRAKSHGLHRGGTPPSRHLCKLHGLLIPF